MKLSFLYPSQEKIKFLFWAFFIVHIINYLLVNFLASFVDSPHAYGTPIPFYVLTCGPYPFASCGSGLIPVGLLFNLLMWIGFVFLFKVEKRSIVAKVLSTVGFVFIGMFVYYGILGDLLKL